MRTGAWRHFDFVLFGATAGLIICGIALIYSATYPITETGESLLDTFLVRQIIYASLGMGLMVLLSFVDYGIFANINRLIYAFTMLSLVLVATVGHISFGAQRWIDLGEVALPALSPDGTMLAFTGLEEGHPQPPQELHRDHQENQRRRAHHRGDISLGAILAGVLVAAPSGGSFCPPAFKCNG